MFRHSLPRRPKLIRTAFLVFIITMISILYLSLHGYYVSTQVIATGATTTFQIPTTTCVPYRAGNQRSFFARELHQTDLPRRISNGSLLEHLRSLRLMVLICTHGVEKHIDRFRNHTDPIVDLFHPSSRILIFDSGSTNGTLDKLQQWNRAEVHTKKELLKLYPHTADRMAYCCNELIDKAQKLQADYILVVEPDVFNSDVASFLSNFQYHTDDWVAMTASNSGSYYDIQSLRTLSESIINFDVWERVRYLQNADQNYCLHTVIDQVIGIHQKPIPVDHGLIEVRSAYGGAALYRANAINDCKYSGKSVTCVHVSFNICVGAEHQGRVFINPEFLVS